MKRYAWLLIIALTLSSFLSGSLPGEETEGQSQETQDMGVLIKSLQEGPAEAKLRAKASLIRLGEKAGPALMKALVATTPDNTYDLIEILAITRYQPAGSEIEKVWQASQENRIKLMASLALCRLDYNYNRYQSYILNRTGVGDEKERLEAMQMLGYIEDKRVVEPLVKIFEDQERPDQIRQAAIWDLGHTPFKESAEALVKMVNNPSVDWFYKEIIIASIRTLAAGNNMAPIVSKLLENSQRLPEPVRKAE